MIPPPEGIRILGEIITNATRRCRKGLGKAALGPVLEQIAMPVPYGDDATWQKGLRIRVGMQRFDPKTGTIMSPVMRTSDQQPPSVQE